MLDQCTVWLHNDVNTTRSTVAYMCASGVSECPNSLHFAPQPAVFELVAILKQVHQMTPPPPTQRQKQLNYVFLVPPNLKV